MHVDWSFFFNPKCPWVVRGCSISLYDRRRRSGDRDLRHLAALHHYSGHICPWLFSMRLITHTHTLLSLTHSMCQSQLKWISWPAVCLTVKPMTLPSCRLPPQSVPLPLPIPLSLVLAKAGILQTNSLQHFRCVFI